MGGWERVGRQWREGTQDRDWVGRVLAEVGERVWRGGAEGGERGVERGAKGGERVWRGGGGAEGREKVWRSGEIVGAESRKEGVR